MTQLQADFTFQVTPKRRIHSITKFNCLMMLYVLNVLFNGLTEQVQCPKSKELFLLIHNLTLGNTWGICANGTGAIGCGDQEMFRNCADIKIISNVGRPPNVVLPKVSIPNALYVPGDLTKKVSTPFVVRSQVCVPVAAQRNNTGMSEWCKENCLKYPPNCDPDRCECL